MSSWKKQWLSELDKTVPQKGEVYSSVPLPEKPEQKPVPPYKRWWVLAPVTAVLIIAIVLTVVFLVPGESADPEPVGAPVMLTVEINPSASFVTDKDGIILNVVALNSDADVVLSGDTLSKINGETLSEGVKMYVDRARELGYINSDEGGALRLSFFEGADDQTVSAVKSAVEDYAKSNGVFIAVLGEVVDEDTFATRSGLTELIGKDIEESLSYVQNMQESYSARLAEATDITKLSELYEEAVSDYKKAFDGVLTAINNSAQKVSTYALDLIDISSSALSILTHSQNPGIIFPYDYWTIKARYDYSELDKDFAVLMEEMDVKLEAYNLKYGKDILSLSDLDALYQKFKNISYNEVLSFIDRVSEGITLKDLAWITEYADALGVEIGEISEIIDIPESIEEYLDKVNKLIGMESEERLSENAETYNAERETLTSDEYAEEYARIIETYGSLSEYWNAIKNN